MRCSVSGKFCMVFCMGGFCCWLFVVFVNFERGDFVLGLYYGGFERGCEVLLLCYRL